MPSAPEREGVQASGAQAFAHLTNQSPAAPGLDQTLPTLCGIDLQFAPAFSSLAPDFSTLSLILPTLSAEGREQHLRRERLLFVPLTCLLSRHLVVMLWFRPRN